MRGHRRQQRIALQLLKFENRNRLRLAVFEKREVALLEIRDHFPGLVPDVRVDDHEVGVRRERRVPAPLRWQAAKQNAGIKQQSFHQNLSLTVAVIDRMAPAAVGNPYCMEFTVVLIPVILT